ncbi:CobW family GTP-binding protein [Teichococcus cervicalis]|uniref:CobW/P47K family protein n=1 Tax=Pseudoroseomonas cervicalis ATCC 49957 TaxID=525371 RepID=D5RGX7_9PROT|nr:GTP-binding protein [Pseudoroseomonas cervicalis]EFH13441.1 CobW/P47K family protein [Pseudoroseomonas cervicalis ATCC 49957]
MSAEFILLAGFLGSGKTTLLRDWLALPEAADTAVIVNEAGQIDVDGAIVADGGTVPLALLNNGCVCCSLTNDLVFTVEALLRQRREAGQGPFRRIILECSGLSKPGPILRSLAPLSPLGLRVRVVATCDAAQAPSRAAHFEEFAAQIAAADTVVLTKLDQAPAEAALALVEGLNPLAARVVEGDPARRALAAFTVAPGLAAGFPETGRAHPEVGVTLAEFGEDASWEDRLDWLENLAAFAGDRLLRVKGFLHPPHAPETALLVQLVGTLQSPPVPMPRGARTPEALVVIARGLDAAALRDVDADAPVRLSRLSDRRLRCD